MSFLHFLPLRPEMHLLRLTSSSLCIFPAYSILLWPTVGPMSIPAVGFPLAISLGFISSFLKANALSTDYSECAVNANRTYWKAPNATFLYDQYGKPTDNVSRAWGISYQSCQALCKTPINFDKYNWNLLSQSLTSWFLPWLALTAQLPFETKDKQTNFAALILALGSPSLITFSLTLTILNARWINRNFRLIREEAGSLRPHRPILMKAVEAARAFLIDSQHVPIQIFNGPRREIAHLIACPQNWAWWLSLYEEAQKSKRRWTYSLYAQIGWVCVEQLLAIVTYLLSASSASSIGIGLAINSLWIWMVPVILGWVYVGTQTSAGSIKAAIVAVVVPVLGQETNVSGECIGIRDRTTFDESCTKPRKSSGNCRRCCDEENRKVRRESSSQQHIELPRFSRGIQQTANTSSNPEEPSRLLLEDEPDDQCSCSPHTFLGFSIAGSDLEPGPIFNYARIWGHMNAVQHVIDAFRTIIQRQQKERTVHGQLWNHDLDGYDGNFRSSPQELSRYISKFDKDEPNLSIQGVSSSNLVLNCITAAFFAVFLQWSSTGAAMVIAYR